MGRGEAPRVEWSDEAVSTVQREVRSGNDDLRFMERVVEQGNLLRALQRVQRTDRVWMDWQSRVLMLSTGTLAGGRYVSSCSRAATSRTWSTV